MSEDYDADATVRLRDKALSLAHAKIEEQASVIEKQIKDFEGLTKYALELETSVADENSKLKEQVTSLSRGQQAINDEWDRCRKREAMLENECCVLRRELVQTEKRLLKSNSVQFDLHAFIRENVARCESPLGFNHKIDDWSKSDWMTALVGEVGEAANVIKKMNRLRDGIKNKKGEKLADLYPALEAEIADTFIYLCLLAVAADIDLPLAVRTKFDATSVEIGYKSTTSDAQWTNHELEKMAATPALGRADGGANIKTKHTGIVSGSAASKNDDSMAYARENPVVPASLVTALHDWLMECASPDMGKFEAEELYREAKRYFDGGPVRPHDMGD